MKQESRALVEQQGGGESTDDEGNRGHRRILRVAIARVTITLHGCLPVGKWKIDSLGRSVHGVQAKGGSDRIGSAWLLEVEN